MTAKMYGQPSIGRKKSCNQDLVLDFMQTVQRDLRLKESFMRGVDVKGRDAFGFTTLYWAIYHGNLHNVKTLLAYGSTLEVSNGMLAPFCAILYDRLNILSYFVEKGIDPTIKYYGLTLLEYAKRLKRMEIVAYLSNLEMDKSISA